MIGYNFNDVKINNRYEIIQMIYQNIDVNRNYITQITGLTNAAVTKIINSLIKERFVSEKNYFSNFRGRKARYLSICEGSFGVITLYCGRSMITASITDICGKIIYSQQYLINYRMIDDMIFNKVVNETIKHFPGSLSCLGCVVISPGIRLVEETDDLNKKTEMPYFWNLKKLYDVINNKYHIPLYTDNICNAALLGEKWFGKGRDSNNFVLYSIGKGIGSAVCIQGKLQRGYHNSAIEIGHTTINFEGPDCDCGNRGCLELYTSTDRWEQKLTLQNAYPDQKNKMEAMFINALRGDNASQELLNQYIQMVTVGAVTLTSIFSPDKLIITTNEADYMYLSPFVHTIKKELETRVYSTRKEEILVDESDLRQTGMALGGIAIAIENTLYTP
jgi:predicted NBD/HSP70 family sugar kinase